MVERFEILRLKNTVIDCHFVIDADMFMRAFISLMRISFPERTNQMSPHAERFACVNAEIKSGLACPVLTGTKLSVCLETKVLLSICFLPFFYLVIQ